MYDDREVDRTDSDFEDCWECLVAEHDKYRKLATSMCRGHYDLIDDLMGVAYERAPQVEMTWDPNVGTLRAHMWTSIRRYMFKFVLARERHMAREGAELVEGAEPTRSDPSADASQDIAALRPMLSDDEWLVLKLRHMDGCTWQVVAERSGLGMAATRRVHEQAMSIAREFFGSRL